MFVTDKKGGQWAIDEGLRDNALQLIDKFDNLIGHVIPDQVIFVRATGVNAKWLGKCYYIGKEPYNLIPKFVSFKLGQFGLLDLKGASFDLEGMDIFDIRYIIVINDDSIGEADGDIQRVEDLTLLHELMHITPEGEGLVPHDLKDFGTLVDQFGPYWGNGQFSEKGEQALDEVYQRSTEDIVDRIVNNMPPFVPLSGTNGGSDFEESD